LQKEFGEAAQLGSKALSSGAYIYPVTGVLYFASHPSLYQAVMPVIVKLLTTSVAVLAGMFIFTYLPQTAFLALFTGPFSFLAAVPLVLVESYAIIMFFSRIFLLSQVQDQLFDAILLQKGHDQLVSKGRQILSSGGKGGSNVKKLGKTVIAPLNKFSREGIVRYLISLPLNAVPIVGTVIFLLFNGVKAGPGFHARYFSLKQWNKKQQDEFVHNNHGAYTAFGAVALALQLVPVVGLLFTLTSTCGAALWAADLESKNRGGPSSDASTGKDAARVEL